MICLRRFYYRYIRPDKFRALSAECDRLRAAYAKAKKAHARRGHIRARLFQIKTQLLKLGA
jgi:hypothetical protein